MGRRIPATDVNSDDRGDYRLFGLPPGRFRVCAAPQGFAEEMSEAHRFVHTCHPAAIAAGDAADIVLTTNDVSGMDIRVQRGGAFKISGSVTDAAGAVADNPHVAAFPIDRRAESSHAVGREGRFTIRGLLAGPIHSPGIGRRTRPSGRDSPAGARTGSRIHVNRGRCRGRRRQRHHDVEGADRSAAA